MGIQRTLKQRLITYGMAAVAYATAINYLDNPKAIIVGGTLGTIVLARELYRDRHVIKSLTNQFFSKITNPIKERFLRKRSTDYVVNMGYSGI